MAEFTSATATEDEMSEGVPRPPDEAEQFRNEIAKRFVAEDIVKSTASEVILKRLTQVILAVTFFLACALPAYCLTLKGDVCSVETKGVSVSGKTYVPLMDVCSVYGINIEWDSAAKRIILQKEGKEAVLLLDSDRIFYDGRIKNMPGPVKLHNSELVVPLSFAKQTVRTVFKISGRRSDSVCGRSSVKGVREDGKPVSWDRAVLSGKRMIKKVVIDAGHGGKDPGAVSRYGFQEKAIILDAAKRIKGELEAAGIDVVLTRASDNFISLEKRTEMANNASADLFVSVHANASKSRWTEGFEVYYFADASDDNARAAELMENSALQYENASYDTMSSSAKAIVADLGLNENRAESNELAKHIRNTAGERMGISKRSVRTARFYVLKKTGIPSVLVELGYVTNKNEAQLLKSPEYRQQMAAAIADGIVRFKRSYEETNGFSE